MTCSQIKEEEAANDYKPDVPDPLKEEVSRIDDEIQNAAANKEPTGGGSITEPARVEIEP